MTIAEAIDYIDNVKDNPYNEHMKRIWLNNIELMIYKQIISNHDGAVPNFVGYNDDTPSDTVLIAEDPYSQLYPAWLEAMIDYANGEYDRYNISASNFNDLFQKYANYYNRTHMPIQGGYKYF